MQARIGTYALVGLFLVVLTGLVVSHYDAVASRHQAAQITLLMHACAPVNTGGGVTQCAQPTRSETRHITAQETCAGDFDYFGVNANDTFALQVRCWNDVQRLMGW